MVQDNEDLSHLTRAALSQLASLSGDIFPDKALKLRYLQVFLELLVPHMKKYNAILSSAAVSSSLSPLFGNQMIGLSNILVCCITWYHKAFIDFDSRTSGKTCNKFSTRDVLSASAYSNCFRQDHLFSFSFFLSFFLIRCLPYNPFFVQILFWTSYVPSLVAACGRLSQ